MSEGPGRSYSELMSQRNGNLTSRERFRTKNQKDSKLTKW